ncbi:MAG: SEC-C metal-binding domain-containing protein [Opitutales bacterium]
MNDTWEHRMPADSIQLPVVRKEPKFGRNEPCPCGSEKKLKKCCL